MSLALPIRRRILLPGPWAREALWKAAREVPSWHIAPARTGNVRDLVTGADLVTFTNSSPAWGFDSAGVLVQPAANVPFVEYDPVTLQSLGWRIWGAVTNLLVRSEEFDDASWTKQSSVSVSANSVTAPTGTTTADTITADVGLGVYQNIAATIGTTYTQSVFGKNGTSNRILFRDDTGAGRHIEFDLTTGQIVSTAGTLISSGSLACGSGWHRIWMTYVADTNTVRGIARPNLAGSAQTFSLFGAQTNVGHLAPYVPTTTLSASSTAEVGDLLSWALANNIRGAYIRGRTTASGTRGLLSGNDNTSSNRIEAITSGTDPRLQVTSSGSSVADINGGTITANTPFRMAMRFDTDSYALSVNGGAVVSDSSGARPTIDRWMLGRTQAGDYGNCYLEELALFSGAPADARLIAMAGA